MTDTDVTAKTMDPATALCTSCGLCCDGSIFNRAKLVPEDGKVETPLFSYVDEESGQTYLKLGCAALNESRSCSVFPNRPKICDTFRCTLLQQLDASEVSLEIAQGKVETALKQRSITLKIVEQFMDVKDRDLRTIHQDYMALGQSDKINQMNIYKEGQLRLNALRRYLRIVFNPRTKSK